MIFCGDVLTVLRNNFGAESVQCVVTSPPYWGLRDYGTAQWEGGDLACDHLGPPFRTKAKINENCGTGTDVKNAEDREFFRAVCGKCGAVRIDQQLGLEPTPEAYVAKMVEVFSEVRRVLKADGTLWLNLGDSYNSGTQFNHHSSGLGKDAMRYSEGARGDWPGHRAMVSGLKPKDLVGIPWRVAFALQADGWYLRSDIIWSKPNPMPESVTDRPTKAHEYLFLLSKSERYWYDQEAIKEDNITLIRRPSYTAIIGNSRHSTFGAGAQSRSLAGGGDNGFIDPAGRNKRTVWEVATNSYPDAHFATFPPKLIEPCILAGSRTGDVVLDPFAGSGTTLAVAKHFGRNGVGIELNPDYVKLAEARLGQVSEALPFETQEAP